MGASDYNEKCLRSTGSKVEGHTKKGTLTPIAIFSFRSSPFFRVPFPGKKGRMLLAAVWHQRRKEEDGPMTPWGRRKKRQECFLPPPSLLLPYACQRRRGGTLFPRCQTIPFSRKISEEFIVGVRYKVQQVIVQHIKIWQHILWNSAAAAT